MKRTIIIALLALIAVAGQAKTFKTIKSPVVSVVPVPCHLGVSGFCPLSPKGSNYPVATVGWRVVVKKKEHGKRKERMLTKKGQA